MAAEAEVKGQAFGMTLGLTQDRISSQFEVLGHLEGLLEAWTGRGFDWHWQDKLDQLTVDQQSRIRQLLGILDPSFIVAIMAGPESSVCSLLEQVAAL